MGDTMPDVEKVVVYVHGIPVSREEVKEWAQLIKDGNSRPIGILDDGQGALPMRDYTFWLRDRSERTVSHPYSEGTPYLDIRVAFVMEGKLAAVTRDCEPVKSGKVAIYPAHPRSTHHRAGTHLVPFADLRRMVDGSWEDGADAKANELARILAPARS